MSNFNREIYYLELMRSRKARDVTLSAWFNFVPDWSRERCEYLRPITELNELGRNKV